MPRIPVLAAVLALGLSASAPSAADPDPANWPSVLAAARGETVYFNAWGGSENINDYIAWAGGEVERRYGVALEHVRLSETADAVNRVLSEKQAGRIEGGAVDLIWINGENFAAMKRAGLLLPEAWADTLPNYALADTEGKPTLLTDFTTPVCGRESPWGTAQLTFYYDSAELSAPPEDIAALGRWIAENPGRFTYAAPPNFIGTTFLKQLAYGLFDDPSVLSKSADPEKFGAITAPLWAFLDKVHPDLWRSGRVFAADTTQLKTLFGDREIDIAMTFNPGEASSAIHDGLVPDTVRSFVMDYGTIGNAHFLAIPFNASAKAGAMVVANFLLSPEAQVKKADEAVWGDPTVLAYEKLAPEDQALFDALDNGPATLGPDALGKALSEPDPSWTEMLEAEWQRRYVGG
ncbi:MAG: ABC transporter substrate-binding protein [Alphaproteobacteria bacterium]|nr:ABC transporter substrate-binding protein [Alphaproteobacteria bacterium]